MSGWEWRHNPKAAVQIICRGIFPCSQRYLYLDELFYQIPSGVRGEGVCVQYMILEVSWMQNMNHTVQNILGMAKLTYSLLSNPLVSWLLFKKTKKNFPHFPQFILSISTYERLWWSRSLDFLYLSFPELFWKRVWVRKCNVGLRNKIFKGWKCLPGSHQEKVQYLYEFYM